MVDIQSVLDNQIVREHRLLMLKTAEELFRNGLANIRTTKDLIAVAEALEVWLAGGEWTLPGE